MVSHVQLSHYLVVAALLFAIGAFGALTRRNAVAVLMGVELMLNAANLNFVAFWRYVDPTRLEGQIFVLIIITVAAAEAAVGLALVLNIYRNFGTVEVDRVNTLKG
ncbi:MAG TPA: NADH-quinone oxidoreductase subunit NuoK [Armatimonadota bacterium]|nr:NADH-quinone oxidoreductase subunit NuoK [Armatimonadota bacterium]